MASPFCDLTRSERLHLRKPVKISYGLTFALRRLCSKKINLASPSRFPPGMSSAIKGIHVLPFALTYVQYAVSTTTSCIEDALRMEAALSELYACTQAAVASACDKCGKSCLRTLKSASIFY